MHLEKQLADWLNEQLIGQDIFLTEFKLGGSGLVSVTLDGDELVPVKKCVEVSRLLNNYLEENNLFEGSFTLEVGSPGADSPLVLSRQFPKHIGRKLAIKHKDGSKIEGILVSANDLEIGISVTVKEKGKKSLIEVKQEPFAEITEVKVVIDFKGKD